MAAAALAACGEDTHTASPAGAPGNAQPAASGILVSLPQADLGVRRWWSDHEQALVRRDAAALTRLDAYPAALITVEEIRVSLGVGQPVLPAARQPTAVRVHVPAQQSWPVPILAVFDVPPAKTGATPGHLAILLMARSAGAPLVALESATLAAPEPAFDVDGGGYTRMLSPTEQTAALGRHASDLSALYAHHMDALARGVSAPSPVAFADGPDTSRLGARDAAFAAKVAAHAAGSVGGVEVGYTDLNVPTPVFALQGGGGMTFFAAQRTETLHPVPSQAFLQDTSRHNYGADLPPGQYPQITTQTLLVIAARMPPSAAPVEPLGIGGGVISAS